MVRDSGTLNGMAERRSRTLSEPFNKADRNSKSALSR
jgi:hypothetical protein